jgi:hypothetical protein
MSKIGDVYDKYGNRIGEVRQGGSGGGGCSSIVFIIIVGIMCSVGGYFCFIGAKNFVKYGTLTSDTKELELRRCIPGTWTVTSREFMLSTETFRGAGERITFDSRTDAGGVGMIDYGASTVYTGDAGTTATYTLSVDFTYQIIGQGMGVGAWHPSRVDRGTDSRHVRGRR